MGKWIEGASELCAGAKPDGDGIGDGLVRLADVGSYASCSPHLQSIFAARRSESVIHDSGPELLPTLPMEAPAALSMKIFSLPKLPTQSPRRPVSRLRRCSRKLRDDFARIERESKKALRRRLFLHS